MRLTHAAVAALCTIVTLPALAQQVAGEGEKSPGHIEAPPLGVPTPILRGFYADLQVGTFFTLNGSAQAPNPGYSNAEPYLGVALGYDLTPNVVVGLNFAYGSSSGTCFGDYDPGAAVSACTDGADSFAVLMLGAYGGYLHPLSRAWYVGGKLTAGLALTTPRPLVLDGADGPGMGLDAGLLLTTEYHTHLDHFVLGLDIGGHYVSAGSGVSFPGIAIYPHLKYVF